VRWRVVVVVVVVVRAWMKTVWMYVVF